MILPIGDQPNPEDYTPWMNYTLLGVNIGIFVYLWVTLGNVGVSADDLYAKAYYEAVGPAMAIEDWVRHLSQYDLVIFKYGFKPGDFFLSDSFTAMFLHAGWGHLLGNMLFLWIYGDNVEYRLGRFGYLVFYVATGIAGDVAYAYTVGSTGIPCVGASGAISGVLGAYFFLFPKNEVRLLVWFYYYITTWMIPSRIVIGFFVIVDNILPIVLAKQSNVAYSAHLGGWFGGFLFAWLGEKYAWNWPWNDWAVTHDAMGKGGQPSGPEEAMEILEDMERALALEDHASALDLLHRGGSPLIRGLGADSCAHLATMLFEDGHEGAAETLLKRSLVLHQHAPAPEQARLYAALGLLRLAQGHKPGAYQFLLTAVDLGPDPATALKVKEGLNKIKVMGHGQP